MPAPLAVDPSNPKPGLYLKVELLRGSSSPGALGLRAAIVSPPATVGGNIVVGTEIRSVFSAEDVEVAIGKGLGYLAYQALIANHPSALVDLVACAESGGAAATGTLTFAGTPTSNMSWRVWVQGVAVDLFWNVGETTTQVRDNNFPRINEKGNDLHAIASAGGAGVINLTARSKGPAGNDIRLRVQLLTGAGGTLTASGATLTGGTTEVDMTTALATLSVREYDYILPCLSNADAQSASGSSNPARVATHIDTYLSGSNAKLQQAVYGSTGSIASAKTNALARNHTNLEHYCSVSDESLPCEIAAAELGDRMRRRSLESNANRVLQPIKRIRGSADVAGDQPTDAEAIDALTNGVTLQGYAASGAPILLRSVTTHSKDTGGNPDRRAFDTSEIDALYDYAKDLRAALPQEFMSPDGQVKIAKNRQPGDEELPAGVVEERDVKAFLVQRTLNFWVPKGVIDGVHFLGVVSDGSLIVQVNASDPTQLDVFIPARVFKILAKIGVVLAKVG
jgi:phage tail sheath gpL-like